MADIINDELEDDEITVVDTPRKRLPKKPKAPTVVISTRLPTSQMKELEDRGIDIPALFRHFVEHDVLGDKTCPTCGQAIIKKGRKQ